MKIFSAEQIRRWDSFSIEEEKITSTDLMERAAKGCVQWLEQHYPFAKKERQFRVFCGKGNNGGDGLAIARMLIKSKCRVQVLICEGTGKESRDFGINLTRLENLKADIRHISNTAQLPSPDADDIIIDAIFGTGLNRPAEGIADDIIRQINRSDCEVIAVDLPSGMYCDSSSKDLTVVRARNTLSFSRKLCFMMAENEPFTGLIHTIDIGASLTFLHQETSPFELTEKTDLQALIKPRPRFAHKGTFGTGTLLAGSYGMMGAAVLAARGFLQSGAGKLNCLIPSCGYIIMQASVPEAMCRTFGEYHIQDPIWPTDSDAIGAGPGIGVHQEHVLWLKKLLQSKSPLVLDADALNILGKNKELIPELPEGTILTPHPKEFERMFGLSNNDFDRLDAARAQAAGLKIWIILKGHRTAIISPDGKVAFNSNGNSGMAKPGTGDVLAGIITGLLAQGYESGAACKIGVYLHGLAGDIAAETFTEQSMTAIDLVQSLSKAWKDLLN